jgi:hypothetical protein
LKFWGLFFHIDFISCNPITICAFYSHYGCQIYL